MIWLKRFNTVKKNSNRCSKYKKGALLPQTFKALSPMHFCQKIYCPSFSISFYVWSHNWLGDWGMCWGPVCGHIDVSTPVCFYPSVFLTSVFPYQCVSLYQCVVILVFLHQRSAQRSSLCPYPWPIEYLTTQYLGKQYLNMILWVHYTSAKSTSEGEYTWINGTPFSCSAVPVHCV